MLERTLAALVGLGVVLPAIVWGGELAVAAVVFVAMLIGIDEWCRMAVPEHHRGATAVLGLTGALVHLQLTWGVPADNLGALALAGLLLMGWSLLAIPDTALGARTANRLLSGLLYVPVLMSFLVLVRRFDGGVAWIFLLLGATWLGDTGAYLAGRAFGKHKLFERVSPKKTWEGAAGGLLFSIAWGCAVKAVALPHVPWIHAIALAALIDTVGVTGDLFESLMKRAYGVKDSGRIMPGHGGILDRIDSLLFSAPVAWAWATFFGLG